MQVGDEIAYRCAEGQVLAGGQTIASAVVQSVGDDGRLLVLVLPDGGEPFTASVPPAEAL